MNLFGHTVDSKTGVWIKNVITKRGQLPLIDYTNSQYIDSATPLEMKCLDVRNHKEPMIFMRTPSQHLQGLDCPLCTEERIQQRKDFVDYCNIKYDGRFDYSDVVYSTRDKVVKITCNLHKNIFITSPREHMKKVTCPDCQIIDDGIKFIEKSDITHRRKYKYTSVIYKGPDIPVCIICAKHGEFYRTPTEHMNKIGCPSCAKKPENKVLTEPIGN